MNQLALIFLLGTLILLVAILVNIFASKLGILTWYEFLKDTHTLDLSTLKGIVSAVFMFILYPFLLGGVAYLGLLII